MYTPDSTGLRNLIVADGVEVGTAPVNLNSGQKRSAILIAALSQDVFLKFSTSTVAPTISESDYHYFVASGDNSSFLGLGEDIRVWAFSPTTTHLNVVEAAY